MTPAQFRLWELIRIDPEKWQLHPWGDEGGGFWVVAIIGNYCQYYNDIEHGFNWSQYQEHGLISDYWCSQDDLEYGVQSLINAIQGLGFSAQAGPPEPIE
ncbi:MAG: hypothetical protein ACYDCO_24220 [Armatimonadota bacterium]